MKNFAVCLIIAFVIVAIGGVAKSNGHSNKGQSVQIRSLSQR